MVLDFELTSLSAAVKVIMIRINLVMRAYVGNKRSIVDSVLSLACMPLYSFDCLSFHASWLAYWAHVSSRQQTAGVLQRQNN